MSLWYPFSVQENSKLFEELISFVFRSFIQTMRSINNKPRGDIFPLTYTFLEIFYFYVPLLSIKHYGQQTRNNNSLEMVLEWFCVSNKLEFIRKSC
jgi:hypothetical protein